MTLRKDAGTRKWRRTELNSFRKERTFGAKKAGTEGLNFN